MDNNVINLMESEIETQQRNVSYDTKEYTIEYIVDKYTKNLENESNEFFVPDYQREFVWDDYRQARFIESLLMGLPIPYIFLAETKDGRYEIVDGSQRIRTLAAFLNDELSIVGLEKISSLNRLSFSQLLGSRQRKFKNISLKMIVLSEQTSDETKNDIFERINRGSDLLKDMEKRKGIYRGPFNDFIYELAKDEQYIKLTPIAKWFENRQEREELLLRYFAFSEWYPNHYSDKKGVARLLDDYIDKKNKSFNDTEKEQLTKDFKQMLDFVEKHFTYGFAKTNSKQISRVYFEALAVGTLLALKESCTINISKQDAFNMMNTSEFKSITAGRYQTHKAQRIKKRVNYVKDYLLKYAE